MREEAAIVIQAAWRGYAVRKRLKSANGRRQLIEDMRTEQATAEKEITNRSEIEAAVESQDESDADVEQGSKKDNSMDFKIYFI
ncbi:unnamed protein product [Toxocara canis]|uniref:IQ motif, EF-hand binding site n=1 Tax=Toxocara canis TaxID=6265 RepID=A0A183U3G4_TOXCA|nr:unnamed protein product [Toxocara canis]